MRLLALSDVHIGHRQNRDALTTIGAYPQDWLILAGDVGESLDHLTFALEILTERFAKIIWTPGNHDLWYRPSHGTDLRGQMKYDALVRICRQFGVVTPEDAYLEWPDAPGTYIVPMFLLFDYSFRPPEVRAENALAWASASGVVSSDERLLDPAPWPSREAWCHARCDATEARLTALPPDASTILVSHWPLRYDLARPPRIPRFSLWCGTTRTESWPVRFRARAVISGHLHFRTTLWRYGVRFDEVSLGYPRDWNAERGIDWYLRQVLPDDDSATRDRFIPARDPFRSREMEIDPS